MKHLLITAFLLITCVNLQGQGNVYRDEYQILSGEARALGVVGNDIIESEKNPAVAFLLGTIVPGMGQMYNEDIGWGFAIFATSGVLAYASESASNDKGSNYLAAAAILWFGSAVAATFQSQSITKKVRLKKAIRDKKMEGSKLGWLNDIELAPYCNGQSTGINLSYSW